MIDQQKAQDNIQSILPNHGISVNNEMGSKKDNLIKQGVATLANRETAKELAKLKIQEKNKLKQELARVEAGIPDGRTKHQHEQITKHEQTINAIEELQAEIASPVTAEVTRRMHPKAAKLILDAQGTTRADVVKLLTSLNINLNLQLSKQDTANLLACLLTCNESQLNALYSNKKVPVAIKTVIKRLLDDSKLGNIETIEKLWDRVFGKNPLTLNLPEGQQQMTGIIPDKPVSREAYIVIRDTLIK